MGIIEFFKNLGSQLKEFAKKVFAEDQFVVSDSNENDIISQIDGAKDVTAEEKKELKKALRGSFNRGDTLVHEQDGAVKLTPADMADLKPDLKPDSTMKDIRVSTTPRVSEKETRVKGGNDRDDRTR